MKIIKQKEWLQERMNFFGIKSKKTIIEGFQKDYLKELIDIDFKTGIIKEDDCKPYRLHKNFLNIL